MKRSLLLSFIVGFGMAGLEPVGWSQPLPQAQPEAQGLSSPRLQRMHRSMQRYVDDNLHAGIITLIARDGKIVDWQTFGHRDRAAQAPMQKETICRIYSMTKLVTTTAVLMLFEEGRIGLDDPIGDYIPELENPKVMTGGTADKPVLVEAESPVTIKQLLTHTSGYIYAFLGNDPIHQIYQRAHLWEADSLEDFIRRVSKLPLNHQPGEAWHYGISLDILGYLVEVVSGQPFDVFLKERIFEPLRMNDTAFFVPESKRSRLAVTYQHGSNEALEPAEPILGAYVQEGRGFPSGGGGLFSTAGNYLRFAQMLLNGGELEDQRILGVKTVELMMVNHLEYLEDPTITWSDSEGFGLGGAVRIDLPAGNNLGSVGQFGWYGAATTYCNIDPQENTVAIFYAQHVPFNEHNAFSKFSTTFYQALVE